MDFLLDSPQSLRIKWLGRYSEPAGKSMYLNAICSDNPSPSRRLSETKGTEVDLCHSSGAQQKPGEHGLRASSALKCRTGSMVLINRLHACQTGKR